MGKTITEKAVIAINELNRVSLLLGRQMKYERLDEPEGYKAYLSAHRKVKAWRKSYLTAGYAEGWDGLNQIQEFHRSDLEAELETANERFGKVLKHYAKAVGAKTG